MEELNFSGDIVKGLAAGSHGQHNDGIQFLQELMKVQEKSLSTKINFINLIEA